jgi:hypothetical protein
MTSIPTLSIRETDSLETPYTDKGTGSRKDLSVWCPRLLGNEYRVVYAATNGSKPAKLFVVKEGDDSNGSALAKPDSFVCKWTDKGTGGKKDGSLWQAVPPPGYVALSDVAVHIPNKGISPGFRAQPSAIDPDFRCVHASLVKDAELGDCTWTDAGSWGTFDGACWAIKSSPGMRVSSGGSQRPPNQQYQLKAFTSNLYRDYALVMAITNKKEVADPDAKYELQQGFSWTETRSTTTSAEVAMEIEQKFSAGVEGISSSSTAMKFKTSFSTSHTLTSSSTATTETKHQITMKVPARTRVELYQLIIKDKRTEGAGQVKIQTGEYIIENVPI